MIESWFIFWVPLYLIGVQSDTKIAIAISTDNTSASVFDISDHSFQPRPVGMLIILCYMTLCVTTPELPLICSDILAHRLLLAGASQTCPAVSVCWLHLNTVNQTPTSGPAICPPLCRRDTSLTIPWLTLGSTFSPYGSHRTQTSASYAHWCADSTMSHCYKETKSSISTCFALTFNISVTHCFVTCVLSFDAAEPNFSIEINNVYLVLC